MTIFRNVVFVAALAGLVAGLAMTAMQFFATTPLIIAAEAYEEMGLAAAETEAAGHDHGHEHGDGLAHASDDAHAHDGWMPEDGAEREFYTVLANIVTAIGFGLVLVVAAELAGGIRDWRQGIYWGFGGFAVFTLAPGLGLPPELPGMPAADLLARQAWWVATVAATAGGLALIAFGRNAILAVVGVALIVAPHVVGAPQPASHESPVPIELHGQFVTAVTLTSLVFWTILGAAIGLLRPRFAEGLTGREQESLA